MTESPGAIRAAEIITGRKYDPTGKDQKRVNTEYGTKTVMGIAAIIDRHTAAPNLLAALDRAEKLLHHAVNGGLNTAKRRATVGDLKAIMRQVRDEAREAVAKAKEN